MGIGQVSTGFCALVKSLRAKSEGFVMQWRAGAVRPHLFAAGFHIEVQRKVGWKDVKLGITGPIQVGTYI